VYVQRVVRTGWLAIAIVAMARTASAQPDGGVEAEPDGGVEAEPDGGAAEDELSPEDLAEIEAAVGADDTTRAEQQPAQGTGTGTGTQGTVQSMNPDIAFIGDVALGVFDTGSDDDSLQTGGHDPTETGFVLQQLEMSIAKAVDPYFRFDANIVFSQFGVEIEEAYATTLALPANLQMRIGQFLTRFGRLNSTHPHTWDFVDQPFVLGRVFGGEGNRGLGVETSYLTPLPWYVEVLGSVTDAGGEATARSFFGAADLPVESPRDFQSTLAVKQFFDLSHDLSLLWGVSVATGPNGTGHDNRSDVWGTDVYLKYRPITSGSYTTVAFQAEWFYRRRQIPEDVLADHGGYAYLYWRFSRRWGTAARYEYGAAATNQDGRAEGDYLDPEWTEGRHRVSANLTFWPTEFSRLRAQASVDVPTWRDDPILAAFLAMEFSVGAHGAHRF
jgi:hypothetical protein